MEKANWRKQIDLYLLGATALLSVVISVLDFLGLLEKIPWLNLDISTLSLLLLGTVALFLAVERRNFLEGIEEELNSGVRAILANNKENTDHIIESLNGVAVRHFDNIVECLAYTNKRVTESKTTIDDTSISPKVGLEWDLPQYRSKDIEHIQRTAKITQKVVYREIFLFNRPAPSRKQKLKMRLDENAPGYSCAYYPEEPIAPLLQFMIIDGEEVILLSDQYPTNIAVRHPSVVKLFKEYYEEMWRKATPIKIGTKIDKVLADSIMRDVLDDKVGK